MFIAFKTYFQWWKTWGRAPVVSWIKAASHYRAGRYDIAHNFYRKGISSHPQHPARHSARLDLAYCLFKMRKFDEAQEQLRLVITQMPETREAHLRLARIQMWIGHSLDAAWTMRRALQKLPVSPEMVALFIINVVDHEGMDYLLQEALGYVENLSAAQRDNLLLQSAFAKLDLKHGRKDAARDKLIGICSQTHCPFEAVLMLGEIFLEEGDLVQARNELKRAMGVAAEHPRVLSLFAETYLKSGSFYNPDYARQLAVSACQNSQWSSPRELHILAEAYFHTGDKISALVLASKAKQAGSRLLGTYGDVKNLDKLIETLSSGTQA